MRIALATLFLCSLARAQVYDQPLTTFDRPLDNLEETTPTLPPRIQRVTKLEAFEKVFITTQTLVGTRTRIVYFVTSDGETSSRTQTIQRFRIVPTARFFTRVKQGYFIHPLDGRAYKNLDAVTTSSQQGGP